MVLARRSLAARLNSGFLNCISGARSEYLGTRRLSAAGMLPGAAAAGWLPAPVSSGWVGASGLPGSIVCVIAASGQVSCSWCRAPHKPSVAGVWSNHSLGMWSNHIK